MYNQNSDLMKQEKFMLPHYDRRRFQRRGTG